MSNSERKSNCKYCDVPFAATDRRDKNFCSDAHAAAWVRENGKARIHDDNYDFTWHVCHNCGKDYTVNGFGERSGQRTPKYCSNACRQSAYRAGKKEQQAAPKTRQQAASGQQQANPKKQQQASRESYWQYVGTSRRAPEAIQAAYRILGVQPGASKSEVRNAYKKLMIQYHPDKNPGVDTTEKAQSINWAFDFVK